MRYASLQEAWGLDAFNNAQPPCRQIKPDVRDPAFYTMPPDVRESSRTSRNIARPHNYFQPPSQGVLTQDCDANTDLKHHLAMLYASEGLAGVVKVLPRQVAAMCSLSSEGSAWSPGVFPRLDGHALTGAVVLCFIFIIMWDVFTRTFRH